jgi:hypothetical protein
MLQRNGHVATTRTRCRRGLYKGDMKIYISYRVTYPSALVGHAVSCTGYLYPTPLTSPPHPTPAATPSSHLDSPSPHKSPRSSSSPSWGTLAARWPGFATRKYQQPPTTNATPSIPATWSEFCETWEKAGQGKRNAYFILRLRSTHLIALHDLHLVTPILALRQRSSGPRSSWREARRDFGSCLVLSSAAEAAAYSSLMLRRHT